MAEAVDFTTVIAVDNNYIEQLQIVWGTWKRFRPELFDHPMVVIYAAECDVYRDRPKWMDHPDMSFISWPVYDGFIDQRDRMLSAFVRAAPQMVSTEWWLKLDCDTYATKHHGRWIPRRDEMEGMAFAGPRWRYTKPAWQMMELDNWAANHKGFRGTKPLGLMPEPGSDLVRHDRVCSWVFWANTEFTVHAANLAEQGCGQLRIPVPSQDGYHWFVAERMGEKYLYRGAKNYWWRNHASIGRLRSAVSEVMCG